MFQTIKKTAKNSIIYGLGNLSSKLIGFILLPLYTSYLSPSEYGILEIIITTSWLLTAIVSAKINAALFRWYWDEKYIQKQNSIFFSSIVFLIFSSFILLAPLIFFRAEISILLFDTNKYSYLIVLMLISTALQVILQLVLNLLQLNEKAGMYSIASILKLILALVLTILFITNFDRGVNGIFEALIFSQIFFFIVASKFILSNIKTKLETTILKEMLVFSYPLIFAEISAIILTVSDRYILNFMTTSADVGIYSLGYRIANSVRVLIYSSVMMAVTPIIYQYINKPNNLRFYSKILTYMTLGVTFFVIFFSIFSNEIIQLVDQNKNYWAASSLVPILSFAILFGILKDVSLTGLNITKKTGIIAIVVVFISIANILLNILFIPIWGAEGAAYATFIVRVSSFIVFFIVAQKYYKIPYEVKKVVLVLVVGLLLILISSLFNEYSLWIKIFTKSVMLLLFPILLYFLKFFEEIEIISLKQSVVDFKNLIFKK